jgi:hypothetical protein
MALILVIISWTKPESWPGNSNVWTGCYRKWYKLSCILVTWIMTTGYSLADSGGLQCTYAADWLPSLYHFSFCLDTIFSVWNWWQYILPKCQCQSTTLQGVRTQKTDFKSRSLHRWIIQCQISTAHNLPPLIYIKISEVWGIVDVNIHASSELSKEDSSEIVVVKNFYSPEILCKSCCF